MSEHTWIRVAAADQIPAREGRVVQLGGHEVAVFNLGGRFLAVQNRCPHRGGPLADGIVSGHSVVCPLHAWKLNLETGVAERPAGQTQCRERYPVRLDGGIIVVGIPAKNVDSCDGEAA